ncbi:MAG: histidinol-phosphatase HisJ family protein [Coriobacteriia bacterium]|nr:histidinol-phosphatase HisJ family protein [Coriobacteriia bacterium]
MIDCHVHTSRCGHAKGDVADYVAVALAKGVTVLTFTEHVPLPERLDPSRIYAMAPEDMPAYEAEVREAAQSAGDMRVLLGVEADWLPDDPDYDVAHLLTTMDVDVVLGSVHFVEGWAFDDPHLIDRYSDIDIDDLWESYFSALNAATASAIFDVIAHPDLVKKFCYMPSFDPAELYDEAARTMAAAGVVAELSTAGLRKPCAELYPSAAFLDRLFAHRVPVTIGSDAHRPTEVGYEYDAARSALREVGYESTVYFVNRQLEEIAL